MKGGLCVIYTSLLTISVISSCALFLLVVSEALQVEGVENARVDVNGLHNVSSKGPKANIESLFGPEEDGKHDIIKDPLFEDTGQAALIADSDVILPDVLSLNAVTTDGLPDTGQPPILISLAENARLNLDAEKILFPNISEDHNETTLFTREDRGPESADESSKDEKIEEKIPELLVVKAKPMHEAKLTDEAFAPASNISPQDNIEIVKESHEEPSKPNLESIPLKPETPHEDIPSFSEWAQKQLAEAEKQDTVLNHSSQPSHSNTNFSSKNNKLLSKNYASPACGAKIVAVNPEAGSASSILSPNRDEYMLNTCNSKIWFVVELCEAVQAQKIEIANFELFSSTPKEFSVYFSDRFPTREWTSVGLFTAKEERDVQSFDLFPHLFGKFIKVEMLSHHGSEHYCPISLFKVYGTSEFEVLEKESAQHAAVEDDDDDDDVLGDVPNVPVSDQQDISKNLFGSARDAVMSIMKKAAQVLVKSEVPKNATNESNNTETDSVTENCCSPSHIIVCDNCSESLYTEVYDLISCSSDKLAYLLRHVFIQETLKCTGICQQFGLDFKNKRTISFRNERADYMTAVFSRNYIAALCNMLAIKDKKVVLNTSFETEKKLTSNITVDELTNNGIDESHNEQSQPMQLPFKENTLTDNEELQKENKIVPEDVPLTQERNDSNTELEKEPPETKEEALINDTLKENELDIELQTLETTTEMPYLTDDQAKTESEKANQPESHPALNTEDKPNGNIVSEDINEQLVLENDGFLSDLDQIIADPTPPGVQSTASPLQNQGQMQKESVFLRLSNRVKTLERNMSLSGQYLEELSRRYKKQVEEMQKSFEKTVLQMTEEKKKTSEREQRHAEQMASLQEQLAHLNIALNVLLEDRNSWFGNITFIKFVFLQTVIISIAIYIINKRFTTEPVLPTNRKTSRSKKNDKGKVRRKSVEGVSGHETPASKKRRPSEEALHIARKSEEVEVEEDDDLEDGDWQIATKNRRRKTSILHRTVGNPEWGRQDSIGVLQENAFPLDEEEFIAPVSEPKEFNGDLNHTKTLPKKEFPKTNGTILNNLKAKTMKSRRLSSPAFFRSALSRQSSRSAPSPVPSLGTNGKLEKNPKRAISESPTGSLWSNSTEVIQFNGQGESVTVKKKKGLKNIFKKVF